LITVTHADHDLNWFQKELREAWSGFLAGREVTITRVEGPRPKFQRP